MKIKKIFSLIIFSIVIMSVFTLVSCTSKPKGPDLETSDLKFDEFGQPIFTDELGKPMTLKVWSVIGQPDNAYLELVNRTFNDYYRTSGLQAEIVSVPQGNFYTQIATTITSDPKNAPDVIIFHSERLSYFVEQNVILPMDDSFELLGENDTFSADNYLTNVIAQCFSNEKLYGVPLDVHAGVWFVRKDIIEKNGLEMPSNKAEFESVCEALMEKKTSGTLLTRDLSTVKSQIDALGGQVSDRDLYEIRENAWKTADSSTDFFPLEMSGADNIESGWIPQTAVLQNGGKLCNEDGTPAWNTNSGLKNTLEMISGWQNKYIGSNRDFNTLWSNLGNGNAVFGLEGPWWLEGRLNEYEKYLGEDSLGILSLSGLYADNPNSSTANAIYGVGHAFGITNSQTNQKSATRRVAAAIYSQFMTENAIKYTSGGHIPACKAVLESEEYLNSEAYNRYLKYMGEPEDFIMLGNTPYFRPVYEQMKFAYIYTLSPNKKGTVDSFIEECYKAAMAEIEADSGL